MADTVTVENQGALERLRDAPWPPPAELTTSLHSVLVGIARTGHVYHEWDLLRPLIKAR
jgi:hypothetical protein